MTLQQAMLPTVPAEYESVAAVRYRPATRALNVCGDWYDLVDLNGRRLAVAVGDVVGHGLEEAGVMGQLHAALNAAICATARPGPALTTVAGYALTLERALAAAAVQTVIDRTTCTITSMGGHLRRSRHGAVASSAVGRGSRSCTACGFGGRHALCGA